MKNIRKTCDNNFKPLVSSSLSFQHNLLYQMCKTNNLPEETRERKSISAGERKTDRLCHLSGLERKCTQGAQKNTINYSLCSSFLTRDYHPQSIHHTVICILHTCTAIWKEAGLRKYTHTHKVPNGSQKPLIHTVTGKQSKWACVCV